MYVYVPLHHSLGLLCTLRPCLGRARVGWALAPLAGVCMLHRQGCVRRGSPHCHRGMHQSMCPRIRNSIRGTLRRKSCIAALDLRGAAMTEAPGTQGAWALCVPALHRWRAARVVVRNMPRGLMLSCQALAVQSSSWEHQLFSGGLLPLLKSFISVCTAWVRRRSSSFLVAERAH